MEDFDCLDQLLNSPSSSDNDLKQRMTWPCHNEDPIQNSYAASMVLSGFELAQEASSDFLVSDSDHTMGLNSCQDRGLGCQFDANGFVPSASLDTYPPGMGNSQFGFPSFQNVAQLSHVPSLEGISSISHPSLSQNAAGGFGFEGQYIDHSSNVPASLSLEDLQSYSWPATMTSKSNGLQSLPQSTAITQLGECDSKIGKPRPRARRGQATDPHSISERIRREKIADRMKNLQELLPNLIKTDKASALDEIIEYVKFLQLQVKVLSTNRPGKVASRATDSQAEGGEGFLVAPSSGPLKSSEAAFDWDEIAFERELVKLMDSNVSEAMEFLHTKGLSLMPVSLASAISPLGGAYRETSNGNEDNVAVKPDQSENHIALRATESRPKS